MFNLFPKKKSVDEIIEDTDITPSMLQTQNDIIDNLIKENNKLRECTDLQREQQEFLYKDNEELKKILENIEEDGTYEHNKAVELRQSIAHLRLEAEKFYKENAELKGELETVELEFNLVLEINNDLNKKLIGLNHLKEENVQLMERINEIDSDMNKEYQAEIFTLRNDIAVLKARNAELLKNNNRLTVDYNGVLHNGGLKYMEAKYQILEHNYQGCTKYRDEYKHQLNAANKEIKKLKEDIVDYVIEKDDEVNELEIRQKKYYVCNHCSYKVAHDTNYWGGCGFCKDGLMIEKEEEQKHPMYPIHWGGLDPDILKQAQEQSIEEVVESLKGMKTQGFEDYDPSDFVKLSYDQSVKIAEMNAVQEKNKEVYGIEEPWQCPCNKCKDKREGRTEKTWEEAASDLALRVAKLEEQLKYTQKIICPK